jgi:cobalt/nickel transport system permease protein
MHIPDGFLTTPVWGGLAAVSAPALAVVARKARRGLEESRVPLMGVMGAFVFAAQMINFPVGVGASGHLLGGALLTITLGPAAASIVLTAVLIIQALVFQDGGLLALGANVFNMAIAGVLASWLPWKGLSGTSWRNGGIWLSGFCSVLTTAFLCLGELALSGVRIGSAALAVSVGVFVVTAALEGAITLAVLLAVEKIHPSWVMAPRPGRSKGAALLAAAAVLLGSLGFLIASDRPDGLEHLAELAGFASLESPRIQSPMADYQLSAGWSAEWVRKAGAGLLGLVITAALCLLVGRWIARTRRT